MHPPDRLTVAACIGCGAMRRPGTCDLGCGKEERLDLVAADEYDAVAAWTQSSGARADALRALVRPLTGEPPADPEAAYRALQRAARTVLRDQPAPPELPEPAQVFTTWWCPACGGVDAPQPCIGICVWRPVEWVAAERYDQARELAVAALGSERALRDLVSRAATVTPRPGRWDLGWAALAESSGMR